MTQKVVKKETRKVLGIDPGEKGAFVVTDGRSHLVSFLMPSSPRGIPFSRLLEVLDRVNDRYGIIPVFLERAVSFGMGTKGAFNYGRGCEAIAIALEVRQFPLTMVEPGKWAKEMHAGIEKDLKPKAKSAIAVERLFPQLVGKLETKPRGGYAEGPMDALLIAGYGLRQLERNREPEDFY